MVGKSEVKSRSVSFYVLLAAAVFVFMQTFSLLSPILLSFLLILLVSLAVNPVISRLRALTGGRKVATGLVAAALVVVIVNILHHGWPVNRPPHSPTPDPILTVSGAAGAKANS